MAPIPKSLRRRQVVSDGPLRGPEGCGPGSGRVSLDDVLGIIVYWHKVPKGTIPARGQDPSAQGVRSDQNPSEKTTTGNVV